MANLLVFLFYLLIVSITLLIARASVFPIVIEVEANINNYEPNSPSSTSLEVFENGEFSPFIYNISELDVAKPPRELKIIAPREAGKYPLILFNHGTSLLNDFYLDLLSHISSHGYIVVAPQYYDSIIPIDGEEELEWAIRVANWIPSGLEAIIPVHTWDQQNVALAGHSRGGLIAFAMALGKHKDTKLQVTISALIGVDPVAGRDSNTPIKPYILTGEPESFDLPIPVTIIGSGKGGACTPEGMNHVEFFRESKAPSSHFVVTKYGHIDMLNDVLTGIHGVVERITCGGNRGPRRYMRSTVGGITVAFLRVILVGILKTLRRLLASHLLHRPPWMSLWSEGNLVAAALLLGFDEQYRDF